MLLTLLPCGCKIKTPKENMSARDLKAGTDDMSHQFWFFVFC